MQRGPIQLLLISLLLMPYKNCCIREKNGFTVRLTAMPKHCCTCNAAAVVRGSEIIRKVEKIVVESNELLRFRLKNGLELLETMEGTVR